jgi:hypothetical protein
MKLKPFMFKEKVLLMTPQTSPSRRLRQKEIDDVSNK